MTTPAELQALLDRATKGPDVPNPAEQKAQGAKCACRGVDDMCTCQNVVSGTGGAIRDLERLAPTLAAEVIRLREIVDAVHDEQLADATQIKELVSNGHWYRAEIDRLTAGRDAAVAANAALMVRLEEARAVMQTIANMEQRILWDAGWMREDDTAFRKHLRDMLFAPGAWLGGKP